MTQKRNAEETTTPFKPLKESHKTDDTIAHWFAWHFSGSWHFSKDTIVVALLFIALRWTQARLWLNFALTSDEGVYSCIVAPGQANALQQGGFVPGAGHLCGLPLCPYHHHQPLCPYQHHQPLCPHHHHQPLIPGYTRFTGTSQGITLDVKKDQTWQHCFDPRPLLFYLQFRHFC